MLRTTAILTAALVAAVTAAAAPPAAQADDPAPADPGTPTAMAVSTGPALVAPAPATPNRCEAPSALAVVSPTPTTTPTGPACAEAVGPPGAGASALRVRIDPVTGRLAPAPEAASTGANASWLAEAVSTSHEGLVTVRLPDGTLMMNLQGRFMNVLSARVEADGRVVLVHGVAESAEEEAP